MPKHWSERDGTIDGGVEGHAAGRKVPWQSQVRSRNQARPVEFNDAANSSTSPRIPLGEARQVIGSGDQVDNLIVFGAANHSDPYPLNFTSRGRNPTGGFFCSPRTLQGAGEYGSQCFQILRSMHFQTYAWSISECAIFDSVTDKRHST